MNGTGDFGTGVTVALTNVEQVNAAARLPGEIAGPALKVAVTVSNGATHPVDLGSVSVNMHDGSDTPASELQSQSDPVHGSVAPGDRSTGTYVFSFPADRTGPATISVIYSTEAPIVLFVGNVR